MESISEQWNISEQIHSTGHNGEKTKGCQGLCVDMFGVSQDAEDTPRRSRQGTHPRKMM